MSFTASLIWESSHVNVPTENQMYSSPFITALTRKILFVLFRSLRNLFVYSFVWSLTLNATKQIVLYVSKILNRSSVQRISLKSKVYLIVSLKKSFKFQVPVILIASQTHRHLESRDYVMNFDWQDYFDVSGEINFHIWGCRDQKNPIPFPTPRDFVPLKLNESETSKPLNRGLSSSRAL